MTGGRFEHTVPPYLKFVVCGICLARMDSQNAKARHLMTQHGALIWVKADFVEWEIPVTQTRLEAA